MNRLTTLFAALLLFTQFTQAQQHEQCGSDHIFNELLRRPDFSNLVKEYHKKINNTLLSTQQKSNQDTLTIPLVVHIMHNGEPVGQGSNISTAQIQSAVQSLNDAYSGNYSSQSVETLIRFELAKRDPNCNSTNGINRINASNTSNYQNVGLVYYGSADNENEIKDLSKWPKEIYYNIWIVSEINDNDGASGTQGFAYLPPVYSSNDGAVILYNAFGYDPNQTKGYNLKSYTNHNITVIHELGHAFGLYHTFQGDLTNDGTLRCPTDSDCGSNGDCVSDTRRHKRDYGCASGSNSCDGGDLSEISSNFLSYSSDACQTNFTQGQKDRMRAAILTERSGLISSSALIAPSNNTNPAQACLTTTTNTNNYFGYGIRNVTLNTLDVSSLSTSGDGGYNDRTCFYFTALEKTSTYSISIKNGINTENIKVFIDYNNDGDFSDASEEVFSSQNKTLHTGSIATPSNLTENQFLRMRVISDKSNNSISSACYNPEMGETEDYSVVFYGSSQPDPIATTQLTQNFCNSTASSMQQTIQCTPVSNASQYEFHILNTNGSPHDVLTQSSNNFSLNSIQNITYNQTYLVKVRSMVNNAWSEFGNTCQLSTPACQNTLLVSYTNETIQGASDGSASVSISGGSAPYTYNWSNGATQQSLQNLSPNNYSVSVYDAFSCLTTENFTIQAGSDPCQNFSVSISSANETTQGASDGSASLNVSGGSAPYTYNWSNGANTASISNLAPATYTATVTDNNNCSEVKSVSVNAGNDPCQNFSVSISSTNETTQGASDGSVSLNVSGGSVPYTYNWSNGANTGSISNLAPATYTATVTDNNNCSDVKSVSVNAGNDPCQNFSVSISSTNETTQGASDGSVSLNVSGGSVPYTYNWSNGANTGSISNLAPATYTATVTDNNNCSDVKSVSIDAGTVQIATTEIHHSQCNTLLNAIDELIYCTPINSAQQYMFEITYPDQSIQYVLSTNNAINLVNQAGIEFDATYHMRVKIQSNNVWGGYAASCSITTPAPPALTTEVQAAYCGTTLSSFTDHIQCNALTNAQEYKWRFITSDGQVIEHPRATQSNLLVLDDVNELQYSSTYQISVKARINNAWQTYGTSCAITTPSAPTTEVKQEFCGQTLDRITDFIECNELSGAEKYIWQITNRQTLEVEEYIRDVNQNDFTFIWLENAQSATTYELRVKAQINGRITEYGSHCQVTTPSDFTTSNQWLNNTSSIIESIYPNPSVAGSASSIRFTNENHKNIMIYNASMQEVFSSSTKAKSIDLPSHLSTGVYTILVQQNTQKESKLLIIK